MNDKELVKDYGISVFIPVFHEKHYQKELGNEKYIALEKVAEKTLELAYLYLDVYLEEPIKSKEEHKQRQHKTFFFNVSKELGKQYDWMYSKLKNHYDTLNIIASSYIFNGHGGLNEKLREVEKAYQENKYKYKI